MALKVKLMTLGCPKNEVDSQVMSNYLQKAGFEIVEEKLKADILVLNTCAFIEKAKRESVEAILENIELKKIFKHKKVVVTGCLAQRYASELQKEIPELDALVGISQLDKIVQACKLAQKGQKSCFVEYPDRTFEEFVSPAVPKTPYAYVKISEGCPHNCTFCAIPSFRGRHRSKSIERIIQEVDFLSQNDVKEVVLVAQDTGIYGIDLYKKYMLPELLERISEKCDVEWVRILYLHPAFCSQAIIETIAKLPKVVKYLDIPLQHISNRLLKAMNRKCSQEMIYNLIYNLREKVPRIALRTTFIVGFPGETEAEFEELMNFAEKVRFERMGVFTYSEEENTASFELSDKNSEEVKKERQEKLLLLQQEILREQNKAKIDKNFLVLIDDILDIEKKLYVGRTYADAPEIDCQVKVKGNNLVKGQIVPVKIIDFEDYDLLGEAYVQNHARAQALHQKERKECQYGLVSGNL